MPILVKGLLRDLIYFNEKRIPLYVLISWGAGLMAAPAVNPLLAKIVRAVTMEPWQVVTLLLAIGSITLLIICLNEYIPTIHKQWWESLDPLKTDEPVRNPPREPALNEQMERILDEEPLQETEPPTSGPISEAEWCRTLPRGSQAARTYGCCCPAPDGMGIPYNPPVINPLCPLHSERKTPAQEMPQAEPEPSKDLWDHLLS